MLKIYCGNDSVGLRQAALEQMEEAREKGFGSDYIDRADHEVGQLTYLAHHQALFGGATAYLLDGFGADADSRQEMETVAPALAASNNMFLLLLGPQKAEEKKFWKKYAGEIREFKTESAGRFNTFTLGDALAARDRKKLWLAFAEGRMSGISAEEMAGVLWWQIKTMLLAAKTKTALEADAKDYPYDKAKRALTRFAHHEVERTALSLLETIQKSRLGGLDLELALERWILRV